MQCNLIRDSIRQVPNDAILNRGILPYEFGLFLKPWLTKADVARRKEQFFEALIYLWVSFNAWLSYVAVDIGEDQTDAYLVQAAGHDMILNEKFNLLMQSDPNFNKLTHEFALLWPVFRVKDLVDKGIDGWQMDTMESRQQYVDRCLASEIKRYSPKCYLKHNYMVPVDWAHTLSTIYQVRCNLFHGGKSFMHGRDRDFVRYAFLILWHIWGNEFLLKLSPTSAVKSNDTSSPLSIEAGRAYYFAYGSNMNEQRMQQREVNFYHKTSARLPGYRLEFNKIASRNPREGYGNIVPDNSASVEGVLYIIDDSSLTTLDRFEGAPRHYKRKKVKVKLANGVTVTAITYIARSDKVQSGLKPSKEYLNHLLAAKDYLTVEYYNRLKQTESL